MADDVVDATNEGSYRVRHAHQRRALTNIRLQAKRATRALKIAVKQFQNAATALEAVATISLENDARELRRRPSLRKKKAKKGARQR